MAATPVIAVFDVGKTNKKLLLFDAQYNVLYEHSEQLPETIDEDGDPCEDVTLLTKWLKERFAHVRADNRFDIRALNFSGYGASFVYIDGEGEVTAPLYNYLKPCPDAFWKKFYHNNGKMHELCVETASPPLKSLNSGFQLYRIKVEKPELYERIKYALHLPQYLSYVFSGQPLTEITSLGCHTHLWDFRKHDYHAWVVKSGLVNKFPPNSKAPVAGTFEGIPVGLGYHDSSAALVPYLQKHHDPFVLVSTGTWCISMNPFNDTPLTIEDFGDDCLCYLTPEGKQVKSSRLFAGPMHEKIEEVLRSHYGLSGSNIKDIAYDPEKIPIPNIRTTTNGTASETIEEYVGLDAEEHYHLGIKHIIQLLKPKIDRVLTPNVKQIFVDGGFSQNKVFMGMLLDAFPSHQVSAASVPQASALGAAIVMREFWD